MVRAAMAQVLHHDANGRVEKRSSTQDACHDPSSGTVGPCQHCFNYFRSSFTEHILDRRHDLCCDGIVAEKKAGHRDGNYDNWVLAKNRAALWLDQSVAASFITVHHITFSPPLLARGRNASGNNKVPGD